MIRIRVMYSSYLKKSFMQIVEILIKNLERLFYFKSGILRRNATREIDMEEKWRILKSFKFITLFSKKK